MLTNTEILDGLKKIPAMISNNVVHWGINYPGLRDEPDLLKEIVRISEVATIPFGASAATLDLILNLKAKNHAAIVSPLGNMSVTNITDLNAQAIALQDIKRYLDWVVNVNTVPLKYVWIDQEKFKENNSDPKELGLLNDRIYSVVRASVGKDCIIFQHARGVSKYFTGYEQQGEYNCIPCYEMSNIGEQWNRLTGNSVATNHFRTDWPVVPVFTFGGETWRTWGDRFWKGKHGFWRGVPAKMSTYYYWGDKYRTSKLWKFVASWPEPLQADEIDGNLWTWAKCFLAFCCGYSDLRKNWIANNDE